MQKSKPEPMLRQWVSEATPKFLRFLAILNIHTPGIDEKESIWLYKGASNLLEDVTGSPGFNRKARLLSHLPVYLSMALAMPVNPSVPTGQLEASKSPSSS